MSWKPSEETIEIVSEAPRDHKWTLEMAIEIAIAIEEPKIREDERKQIQAMEGGLLEAEAAVIRADQMRKIMEALRKESNTAHGDTVLARLSEAARSREKWYWFNRAADFIEREFG